MDERAKSYHWSFDGEIVTVDQMTYDQAIKSVCDLIDLVENIDVKARFASDALRAVDTISGAIDKWRDVRYYGVGANQLRP